VPRNEGHDAAGIVDHDPAIGVMPGGRRIESTEREAELAASLGGQPRRRDRRAAGGVSSRIRLHPQAGAARQGHAVADARATASGQGNRPEMREPNSSSHAA
jgi:hypothetical protein